MQGSDLGARKAGVRVYGPCRLKRGRSPPGLVGASRGPACPTALGVLAASIFGPIGSVQYDDPDDGASRPLLTRGGPLHRLAQATGRFALEWVVGIVGIRNPPARVSTSTISARVHQAPTSPSRPPPPSKTAPIAAPAATRPASAPTLTLRGPDTDNNSVLMNETPLKYYDLHMIELT